MAACAFPSGSFLSAMLMGATMLTEEQINEFVGKQLRDQRKMSALTLSLIAEEINLSPQQVQKYEWSINRISAGKLYHFAEMFGVPIAEFFPVQKSQSVSVKPPTSLRIMKLVNGIDPKHHELIYALLKVAVRLIAGGKHAKR